MRAGRIPHDSPELAFLFDTGHPENLINRGMDMARLHTGSEKQQVKEQVPDGVVVREDSKEHHTVQEMKREDVMRK